jgi:aryl-alcohol dehydrogenase-like predicted oxidoreductase
VDTLDLVQFHWWNFDVPGWLEAAGHLAELKRSGKIRQLGVTNFDTSRLRTLLDAGIPIVSHQVQCSLLDRRALGDMTTLCAERGVGLLTYGALAGGFFHERWLGAREPIEPLENRSLVKYKLIIDEFGGWTAFQQLLRTMRGIADAHDSTIGAVALRAVLDEAAVTSVIVGARHADHLPATLASLSLEFSASERTALQALVAAGAPEFAVASYREHDLGSGSGASAIAYIQIRCEDGRTRWGAAVDTNIELAGVKAVVSALNRVD